MKTTVDIADSILAAAKETAQREGTTLRSLVEEGLRLSLERRRASQEAERFRLRDAGVGGEGVRDDLKGAGRSASVTPPSVPWFDRCPPPG